MAQSRTYSGGTLTNIQTNLTRKYVYAGGVVIGELDNSDNLVREYVRGFSLGGGIGGIFYCKQGGSLYYYYYDGSWKRTTVKNDSVALDTTPSNACTYDENGNPTGRTKSLDAMILWVVLHGGGRACTNGNALKEGATCPFQEIDVD